MSFLKLAAKIMGAVIGLTLVALGVGTGYILWTSSRLPPPEETSSVLAGMVDADQEMRTQGVGGILAAVQWKIGDWKRLRKVRRMVEAGRLETATDYRRAAFLLQHGNRPSDFAQARDLADVAAERGDDAARRLQALAEDRYRLSVGQKQKYGSQIRCIPGEGWSLEPFDPSTSDADRAAVGIEPLDDLRAKVERLNRMTDGECRMSVEQMRELEKIMRPSRTPSEAEGALGNVDPS